MKSNPYEAGLNLSSYNKLFSSRQQGDYEYFASVSIARVEKNILFSHPTLYNRHPSIYKADKLNVRDKISITRFSYPCQIKMKTLII